MTSVEVVADRIVLRPSLGDMLKCRRIAGGRYDSAQKAWVFPATAQVAASIRQVLRAVEASPDFNALLTPVPDSPVIQAVVRHFAETSAEVVVEQAIVDAPQFVMPDGLRTQPWAHQRNAFEFAMRLFQAGHRGVLLAMGMGTGKSLSAIMLLLAIRARRVLIVSPLRVVDVWVTQLERHMGARAIIVTLAEDAGTVAKKRDLAAEKMRLAQTMGVPFICIVNYDSVWREPLTGWAEMHQWDLIIADEAHRIKAPGGKASLFFKRMRPRSMHRLALTGTPMPHSPLDVYAVFRFLDQTIFGTSYAAFRQSYAVMGGYQNKQIVSFQKLDELQRRMGKITFRVGKEVLDLPPEMHVTYKCDLGRDARRIYRELEDDFVASVLEGTVTAANALVKLLRLQQITGGVVPTDDHIVRRIDDAKQKLLADTLEDIGPDEPVAVFCRFHADLDAIHEACRANAITSLELSGRRDELREWQEAKAQALATQISAGGVGVDMTRARYLIFYSLSFSLGEYDQALSRVHRPGQTRPVQYIHLVVRNTVDGRIMRALERRAEVVQAILAEITQHQTENG